MASPKTLSIAMATYNGAAFLRQQLASLAAQTLPPHELVATDDGSTDATLDILDAFAAGAPFPVRIYRSGQRLDAIARNPAPEAAYWADLLRNGQRLGYADNFLLCAHLCAGDLIAFCDQDDIWLPAKNERSVAPFADPTIGLVSCSGTIVDGEDVASGIRLPDHARDVVLDRLAISPWTNIVGFSQTFRRDLLSIIPCDVRPPDHINGRPLAHDRWTFYLNHALHKTAFLAESLVRHRRHDANTTGRWRRPSLASNMALVTAAGADTYAGLSRCARGRADIFARSPSGRSNFAAEFAAAARYYGELSRRLAQRSSLHRQSAGLLERWRTFWELLRAGGYRPSGEGGFGRKALVKDIMACVAGGRRKS